MSTADKIFEKARALPEPAQALVLQWLENLTRRTVVSDAPMTEAEAAEMRAQLGAWEQDWNASGMEAYDRP